jgi:hypothetical protein
MKGLVGKLIGIAVCRWKDIINMDDKGKGYEAVEWIRVCQAALKVVTSFRLCIK